MCELLTSTSADFDWDDLDEAASDNPCMICFASLTEGEIKLKCGHNFCYKCLLESYKGVNCNNITKNHRICPYCRKPADYLPLREGITPIMGIHREYKKYKKPTQYVQCVGIVKSGPNKGQQCTCKARTNGYCGRHVPK